MEITFKLADLDPDERAQVLSELTNVVTVVINTTFAKHIEAIVQRMVYQEFQMRNANTTSLIEKEISCRIEHIEERVNTAVSKEIGKMVSKEIGKTGLMLMKK